jgi:hypothetical protein
MSPISASTPSSAVWKGPEFGSTQVDSAPGVATDSVQAIKRFQNAEGDFFEQTGFGQREPRAFSEDEWMSISKLLKNNRQAPALIVEAAEKPSASATTLPNKNGLRISEPEQTSLYDTNDDGAVLKASDEKQNPIMEAFFTTSDAVNQRKFIQTVHFSRRLNPAGNFRV